MGRSKLAGNDRASPGNTQIQQNKLQQAINLQRGGNLKAAERKFRDILKRAPNHSEALQHLAILLQQAGNTNAALHFMHKALDTSPQNPHLLKNLAELYRLQGDMGNARTYVERALSLQADNIDALVILGAVYFCLNQPQRAIEQYNRALELDPEDATVRNELGIALASTGQYEFAAEQHQHALTRQPEFDVCRLNLANTFLESGAYDDAIGQYRQLLTRQPENASILIFLGNAYKKQGNLDSAILSYQAALEKNPEMLEARLNLGKIDLATDLRQAENWFSSVLEIDPEYAEGYYWLGVVFQTLGKFGQAAGYFEKAIRLRPEFHIAWYRLSLDRGYKPSLQQVQLLEMQFSTTAANHSLDGTLVTLGFTLGKFHEQRGEYSAAFEYYQHGNRVKAQLNPFDRARHDDQIDNIIDTFDSGFFEQRLNWGDPSRLPVFIIGMPRSGTTLVEQILSAHASIHGAGELPLMQDMVASLKGTGTALSASHAEPVRDLEQPHVVRLAREYLRDMQALNPQASRILDKLPGNFFRLGIICLLFPAARIIHCKRAPMDTCWSCYQQNFERGLLFTNDLEDIGHAYNGYLRLMAHWHEVLPVRIFDVQYEDLVNDPETISRQLLQHCAVEWDPAVLDYHQHQRPVSTASMWQVRQPMYKSSIGRWKIYQQYLQPLRQALSTRQEQ